MSKISVSIREAEEFIGLIEFEKLDSNDEPIVRKITKGLCLGTLLRDASGNKLSLGAVEVNLDFDSDGELVQMEIYT